MKSENSAGLVTMQQIAERAGVSKMTVSRALKNHPRLAEATKRRIRDLARRMGYRPHPYVSALMARIAKGDASERPVNLAVIHFGPEAGTRDHFYFRGLAARADALGYGVEMFPYRPEAVSPRQLRKTLVARGHRGIVLMPAAEGFFSMDFDFSGFAVAAIGHSIVHPPLPRVGNDIHAGMFRALDELKARGYRRAGLINSRHVTQLSRFLYSGALTAYRGYDGGEMDLREFHPDPPLDSARSRKKIAQWVRATKRDVILSASFDFALHEDLRESGFSIPDSLGYLHLLDHPNRRITSLSPRSEFAGAKAVDVVVASIHRNEFNPSEHPYLLGIEPGWHPGRTLRSF